MPTNKTSDAKTNKTNKTKTQKKLTKLEKDAISAAALALRNGSSIGGQMLATVAHKKK